MISSPSVVAAAPNPKDFERQSQITLTRREFGRLSIASAAREKGSGMGSCSLNPSYKRRQVPGPTELPRACPPEDPTHRENRFCETAPCQPEQRIELTPLSKQKGQHDRSTLPTCSVDNSNLWAMCRKHSWPACEINLLSSRCYQRESWYPRTARRGL